MGGNNKNIAEDGKATRFGQKGVDNTKGGRKPSIRNQLKELMLKDGIMRIPKSQIVSLTEKDGSILIKLPKQEQLSLKLMQWALSNKGVNSIKAIQMVMEQIDGKPKQEIEQTNINEEPDFSKMSNDEIVQFAKLQAKLNN